MFDQEEADRAGQVLKRSCDRTCVDERLSSSAAQAVICRVMTLRFYSAEKRNLLRSAGL
jgi:hypothetical protein